MYRQLLSWTVAVAGVTIAIVVITAMETVAICIAIIRPAAPSVITIATARYRHQRQRHYSLKQRPVQRMITATASPSMLKSSNSTNQS
ncbi:hypothetical protein BDB00DRAFT_829077 [Zychaea mexicana]|uniref:uncharacterized protein n=1 Tax=Zychaea mexicana TaxID=64656 RepID=UPI0022FEEC80|nr:uncharacterized protein BDB00DRAFT_829077 [Zychaea mexicana]KAI9492262.1 hypothetical protein BDB00DRAFT_829077 [Zychaea mexicana]